MDQDRDIEDLQRRIREQINKIDEMLLKKRKKATAKETIILPFEEKEVNLPFLFEVIDPSNGTQFSQNLLQQKCVSWCVEFESKIPLNYTLNLGDLCFVRNICNISGVYFCWSKNKVYYLPTNPKASR